jgi:hypothetical protein
MWITDRSRCLTLDRVAVAWCWDSDNLQAVESGTQGTVVCSLCASPERMSSTYARQSPSTCRVASLPPGADAADTAHATGVATSLSLSRRWPRASTAELLLRSLGMIRSRGRLLHLRSSDPPPGSWPPAMLPIASFSAYRSVLAS